ncbi:MAG: bifunctional nicotinamidase/pyrazinamidase [Deltaproteobacteria bacterium]|nr:bifunctional nicotinamidase/pyrazinamidase [Deltaproteobacteria bacterium]
MNRSALLIIDAQNDFCPGGALPVKDGAEVVPVLNRYIELFTAAGFPVYATRDWHPSETRHFKKFGGAWPPHCVQGTEGAEFHPGLRLPENAVIISKGEQYDADSYSGFDGHDAEGSPLEDLLRYRGVTHIYAGGLATDYCVRQTVLDALKKGFEVTLLLDAVRGVDVKEGDSERSIEEMIESGARTAIIDEVELA